MVLGNYMAKKKIKIQITKQDMMLMGMTAVLGYMAILGVCLLYHSIHG
jgi:hypothetical protein